MSETNEETAEQPEEKPEESTTVATVTNELANRSPLTILSELTGMAPAEMTDEEQYIQTIMDEDGEGDVEDLELARIKLGAGGGGDFLMGDKTDKESTFDAIVLIAQKTRGYWPKRGLGNPPLCSSSDGTYGTFAIEPDEDDLEAAKSADSPHSYFVVGPQKRFDCSTCALNEWGSEHQEGRSGRGKACKEMRRLLILINGWSMPAILTLPPTSLRTWEGYRSRLISKRSAVFAVWTKFELEQAEATGGEKYDTVQVTDTGSLDLSTLKAVREVRKAWASHVKSMDVVGDDYEMGDGSDTNGGGRYIEGTVADGGADTSDVPFGDESPAEDELF